MYVFELPSACCSSTPTSSSQPHKFHHFPSSSSAKKPLLSSLSDIASQDSIWQSFLSPSLSVIPKGKHTTRPHHHLNQLHNSHPRLQPGPALGRDHSQSRAFRRLFPTGEGNQLSMVGNTCALHLPVGIHLRWLSIAESRRLLSKQTRLAFVLVSTATHQTCLLFTTLINTSNCTALHHIILKCVFDLHQ